MRQGYKVLSSRSFLHKSTKKYQEKNVKLSKKKKKGRKELIAPFFYLENAFAQIENFFIECQDQATDCCRWQKKAKCSTC